jgi:phosphohistidine phosphatase
MLLYLVQHGEAKREDEDPARGLTEKGGKDVKKVAQFLQNRNLLLSKIYHSNKNRARETARIFAEHLKPAQGVFEDGNLAPMDEPETWANRIAGINADIMLVGHLPFMARLAGLLMCSEKEKAIVDFKMGSIVCLTRSDDKRWSLEWMIVPEILGNVC